MKFKLFSVTTESKMSQSRVGTMQSCCSTENDLWLYKTIL